MDKDKKYEWAGIKLVLNGVEIKNISTIEYVHKQSKEELLLELSECEAEENYERCAEIRDLLNTL